MTFRITGESRMGPLGKDRSTPDAALEEARDLEKRGYGRVRIRNARGQRFDVKTFARLVAAGRMSSG